VRSAALTARVPGRVDRPTQAWRLLVRGVLRLHLALLDLAARIGPRRRSPAPGGVRILLTGTFHSDHWIRAHLGPLAASTGCAGVTMVTTSALPPLPKVHAVSPPGWLVAATGAVPARLLTFVIVGLRSRPDVVGGFHLLINGLVAGLLARMSGAASWYFSVGGPTELVDGGVWGENPYFARLRAPDPVVEALLLDAVRRFDVVITMGTGAAGFLRERGVTGAIEVVPGGIDRALFPAGRRPPEFDLVLVARLVPIKQIDLFIRVVALLRESRIVRAAIVGDGPLRGELEQLAAGLGAADVVTFAGRQTDVSGWLARSRIFVLTSESEGLALSMMEAMMCGLPAIVPRVGDLENLVSDGRNGYLIDEPSAPAFASAIVRLLDDPARYAAFSAAAERAALAFTVEATTATWDRILGNAPAI
jgi:glycosyltransferase involved in cell wall biosynthesis